MTPEEVERRMEFIIEQQAQFAVNIEKLRESDERLHASQERLWESQQRLHDSQATLTAALVRVAEIVEDLSEVQKRTDEKLNALIDTVERHISGPGHSTEPRA
jgi:DNA repair ATPase RecN